MRLKGNDSLENIFSTSDTHENSRDSPIKREMRQSDPLPTCGICIFNTTKSQEDISTGRCRSKCKRWQHQNLFAKLATLGTHQVMGYFKYYTTVILCIWLTFTSCNAHPKENIVHEDFIRQFRSNQPRWIGKEYISSYNPLDSFKFLFHSKKMRHYMNSLDESSQERLEDGITGMWAVKLKFEHDKDSREELDLSADIIAQEHGLENHGQIGELKGYYLFMKKDSPETWTTMASAIASSSSIQEERDEQQTPKTEEKSITSHTTPYVAGLATTTDSPVTTDVYTDGEVEPTHLFSTQEPTQRMLEKGLIQHNQVEWQGHQVLLTRSKRGYLPILKMDKTDLQAEKRLKLKNQKITQNVTTTTLDFASVPNTTMLISTKSQLIPSSPNPSEKSEEESRHNFYIKIVNKHSHPTTVTPQQLEITYNQKYKDLIGSSGGGIGGRRMGLDTEEEESAGDWWPPYNADSLENNHGTSGKFSDPLFLRQWHLQNSESKAGVGDCNVTGVWKYGITGRGVVVAVVDDGVQWDHPDLIDNYCPEGSFDLNANDDDPMPVRDNKEENKHGTRCAGEIAAVPNDHCGVGVAYGAKFSGIRILDGPLTDSMEAAAFNKHLDINDIYSCSWGPEDDGKTIDGPHPLAQAALKHGVVAGRHGLGSIYIVASGNGGHKGDNCNYDGYANSIYTITIGAVDEFGRVPSYAEKCASMLACTFSSGAGNEDGSARKIVTTDWTLGKNKKRTSGCTESHTGTSAATPLAAGMVALMLEARPCLTWRDIQHIMVMTAIKIKPDGEEWTTNSAGFHHSDERGFGLLNAWRMVNAARVWRPVPWLTSLDLECPDRHQIIPNTKKRALIVKMLVTEKQCRNNMVYTLEQVLITVDIEHPRRGDLFISLVCPSGTTSVIGGPRKNDDSSSGLWNWTFATVKCWGEQPFGTYRLIIHDTVDRPRTMMGELRNWKITLYGSMLTQIDIEAQRERVEEAMSGEYLKPFNIDDFATNKNKSNNITSSDNMQVGYCPPLELNQYESALTEKPPTERVLKLIALSGCFLLLWGLYCSLDVVTVQKSEPEIAVITIHEENRNETKSNFVHHVSKTNSWWTETTHWLLREPKSEYCKPLTKNIDS
uniref:uncharacterized protein LOC120341514 n=1 Tax=Styela clava TaxID=7725 RepID=UPI00193A9364|nr:uncharacterized protein LOC120341514 [Styela clava]